MADVNRIGARVKIGVALAAGPKLCVGAPFWAHRERLRTKQRRHQPRCRTPSETFPPAVYHGRPSEGAPKLIWQPVRLTSRVWCWPAVSRLERRTRSTKSKAQSSVLSAQRL